MQQLLQLILQHLLAGGHLTQNHLGRQRFVGSGGGGQFGFLRQERGPQLIEHTIGDQHLLARLREASSSSRASITATRAFTRVAIASRFVFTAALAGFGAMRPGSSATDA